MIRATCETDDGRRRAEFDATPFFVQATDDEIRGLAALGDDGSTWGGDYEADAVSDFLRDTVPSLDALYTYLEEMNVARAASGQDPVGYRCEVTKTDALAWVTVNRPHLLAEISG